MRPVVFIHAKKDQWVGAEVSAYSLKRNSASPDLFDIRIIYAEDFPQLRRLCGKRFLRDRYKIYYSFRDPQSFTLLRFAVPKLMGFEGHAIVIDPDIFALGDIWELLSRDLHDKAVLCRKVRPAQDSKKPNTRPMNVTSVMLMDCAKLKHWDWERDLKDLFSGTRQYNKWFSLAYEDPEAVGEIEECWNHYDTLTPETKLLHNTRRRSQPWMTGVRYDSYGPQHRFLGLIPKHWFTRDVYEPHPDKNQEKLFFGFLRECVEKDRIPKQRLMEAIRKKQLRADAFARMGLDA